MAMMHENLKKSRCHKFHPELLYEYINPSIQCWILFRLA